MSLSAAAARNTVHVQRVCECVFCMCVCARARVCENVSARVSEAQGSRSRLSLTDFFFASLKRALTFSCSRSRLPLLVMLGRVRGTWRRERGRIVGANLQ